MAGAISIGGFPGIADTGVAALGGYHRKVLATSIANLIGYWKMDERLGTVSFDGSPEGNDGAYTGVALGATGIGDGRPAPTFDGTNDFNNIYSAAFNTDWNGAEGTLMVWGIVRAGSVWTDGSVRSLAHIRTDGSNLVYIVKSANDTVQYAYIAGGTTESNDLTISTTIWNCYVITWSSAADEVIYYLNGSTTGTTDTVLGTYTGDLNSAQCNIGARFTTPTWQWDGELAHVAVWNTPLTSAQIATLAVA